MKHKTSRRLLSLLLALVMVVGMIPVTTLTVFAAHRCPDCEDLIDGSPYCDECYKCDACVDLCLECGKCSDCGNEICDGCSDEECGKMCVECAKEKGSHCPECDGCYFAIQLWCEECGKCADCAEICDTCSVQLGEGMLCVDCAADKESHCFGCGGCLFEIQGWCEECGLCFECVTQDEICSEYLGKVICKECASYYDSHCPSCDGCYGDSGGWCEECGQCNECSEICTYCCEEAGETICIECAIEQGLHCPECSNCYGECGGDSCSQCGICAACADICYAEELCIDCAIAEGYHCPSCEACGDSYVICEGCGEKCIDCSDSFCENCNLCGECVKVCQDCGSCEECATICPNCEEYCSECAGICDDCGLCIVCCEDIARMNGCDCDGEWVCFEGSEWEEHFEEYHTETEGSHSVRPTAVWNFDSNYHWHDCAYCDDAGHQTSKSAHSYDATGKCTVCYYVKDAKIQIIVQPKDVKYAIVTSSEEDPDERNLAYFSVVAIGNSELTYTWCRQYYEQGQLTYKPLGTPDALENYTGPNLAILAPVDACTNEYYICCFITDEEGNEVKTVDVLLTGIHDYQYYKEWKTHERPYAYAERNQYGHILQCVGDDCGKLTRLRPHEDEDRDGYCDICDYEIGKILITKQPKDSKSAYVWGQYEDYDESNIAHFSVEAEGESELTYTWCRKMYVQGVLTYVPLTNPQPGENYTGPNLDILVPMDSCCNEYTYACIITDEEGNETRTMDVVLTAKHNYQYYKEYKSHENPYPDARRRYNAHVLVCVGDDCGKVTRYRQHIDENHDYFCDICDKQKDFQEINLTVTAPKEGQLPSYTVGTDSVAYFAMGGSNDYTQYRFWLVSDDGVNNWKIIDKTTPFVAGKYYKFIVEMQVGSKYEFPTYNSTPNFWAKVNGDYATVEKTYGKDPAKYVTVEYEFGMCNDSVIENIIIENVTIPVAGEKPAYTATVRGSGYYINTDKNAYYDAYWKNPPEKWYYIKNGVGWFDMTEGDWVYEHDTFIPGHEYQINVYLKTDDGYEFKLSKYLDIEFTASVNGFVATGVNNNNDCRTQQTVSGTFTCESKKVTTVMINGLAAPRGGEHPDYAANVAYPEWYRLDPNYAGTNGIVWSDMEGNQLLPEDTFMEGKKYKVEIKLIPATLNGANTAQFVSPVDAYVNGKQVVANGDDMVYGNANTVYIYYTFPNPASASANTKSVTGSVTSFNDANGDITLQLIEQGLTEPAYETVVKGNTVNYNFASVAAGTYTLKVSKANHVTREYTVVISTDDVTQDAKIHLAGDIDGNGTVTTMDFMRANSHARGVTLLSDYALKCADVVGTDGTVTTMDAMRINAHAKGANLLW